MYSFAYSVKNNLNKNLREKEVKKKKIYIKVQIDRAATSGASGKRGNLDINL